MPELPEVETTCSGIAPHIQGKSIAGLAVRQAQLRWPIPDDLAMLIKGQTVLEIKGSEYLIFH